MGTVMGSPVRRYGIALFALAAATQMTQQSTPLRAPLSFWPFLLAVLVSVWSGGAGPGLLASLGSTLAISYLLLPPVYSLQVGNLDDFLWLELFGLASVLLGRGARPEPPDRGCVVGPSRRPEILPHIPRRAPHWWESLPPRALGTAERPPAGLHRPPVSALTRPG